MTKYLIGTGGWAYFRVPRLHPLKAYSKAFNFVEVNSTFYEMPSLKTVEKWRRMVPPQFEFSVRCNREVTHRSKFQGVDRAFLAFERMIGICRTLNSEILHLQLPRTFKLNALNVGRIRDFLSSSNLKGLRMALGLRGKKELGGDILELMRDYDMVHCVDLSKDEKPALKSDILYSRLFGKGRHNVYQPTDEELRKVDRKASKGDHRTVAISFHFVRMYKDAARLKVYKQTGKFPMVTKSTGLSSLAEVLREDAKFPSSKKELIQHQGWKLIDFTKTKRVRASYVLQKLPEKTYDSVSKVVQTLEQVKSW